jgi:hypothetical protein
MGLFGLLRGVQGSEDGTVKVWHSTTYRLENTLDYRMERVWSLGYTKGSNWWGCAARARGVVRAEVRSAYCPAGEGWRGARASRRLLAVEGVVRRTAGAGQRTALGVRHPTASSCRRTAAACDGFILHRLIGLLR